MDKKKTSKYKEPPRVKVGRCWFVTGYDGVPIKGLSWDSANGYFYYTFFKDTKEFKEKGKRIQFGKDYDLAIAEFRKWQGKHEGKNVRVSFYDKDHPDDTVEIYKKTAREILVIREDGNFDYGPKRLVEIYANMPEDIIIAKSKELFAKYPPSVIAEKYGMPSFAKIDYLDDLQEPHSLKEIGDCYFNKIEFINPSSETAKEIRKVKRSWKRFCSKVDVQLVKEVTKERLREYYNDVFQEYRTKKWSTTWISGHFERVKRVLNNAIDTLDNVNDIIEAKLRCASVLKSPKAEVQEKAYRITRSQFHEILKHSNIEETCMWLLSMNMAYYSVDVATLPVSAINIEDEIVVFRRGKTGNHRSGVLWDITIDSITEYQNTIKHDGETLFLNMQDNVPYLPNRIRKKFIQVVEKAGIRGNGAKRLCHRNFRDSLKSICVEKGIRSASVNAVMGHHTKHDEYVDPEVFPKISEEACKAVYEYYFGK
jgi:integrase